MVPPLRRRLLPAAYRSLFADPTFRRLMPAFALSDLGDGMSTVADGWLLAVLLGAIPVVHAIGALTPARYVALLAASSLLHAWGRAGRNAVLAPVLREDQRIAANSLLSTSSWAAVIAGPALAGLLAGAISPAWIIDLDALTFVVLALQAGRPSGPTTTTPGPAGSPIVARSRPGLGILVRQPELLGLLIVTFFFNLDFGPVEVALPLFVTDDLHAGPGLLGTYWAVFGAGAVIGALGLGAARRLPLWPVMLAIIAGHGLGLLPFAQNSGPVPSLIGFAACGVIYGPYSALSFSLLQERTPAAHLTTVLAARTAVLLAASPAGAAFGGLLVVRTGPATLIACCGLAMVALAAAAGLVRYTGPEGRPGQATSTSIAIGTWLVRTS